MKRSYQQSSSSSASLEPPKSKSRQNPDGDGFVEDESTKIFIKSVLIQLYAKRGDAVLALACGKVRLDKALADDAPFDLCSCQPMDWYLAIASSGFNLMMISQKRRVLNLLYSMLSIAQSGLFHLVSLNHWKKRGGRSLWAGVARATAQILAPKATPGFSGWLRH
ncbi:hypothetical protein QVD17_12656 [Tagetes erecta]|uniref:Uncharacterized protein n=1 Tax=Tagetes erecta TaxID=13708 RepID=A0AAD8L1A2_TARER|nr:hypothetical protein QVD17_12656 [Tagetes erecta]